MITDAVERTDASSRSRTAVSVAAPIAATIATDPITLCALLIMMRHLLGSAPDGPTRASDHGRPRHQVSASAATTNPQQGDEGR